ncbi:MAG: response regulator [Pseudomonadota bacterium]
MPTPKVLVIDDEKRMCESLKLLLSGEGYEVCTAENCREGIGFLEKGNYGLVVTDLVTPYLTGFDVMDYVRENCPETLVIAMTGYASLDSAVEAMRRGAYDYIAKPFNFEVMKLIVKRAIDRHELAERVKMTEQKYRSLVEEINDGYFVLQDRRLVYANKTFAEMLQYEPDEIRGLDFTCFLDLEAYSRLEKMALGTHNNGQEEFCLRSKDSEVPVEVRVTQTYRDGQLSLVGICRDIRERKALWDKMMRTEKLASLGGLIAGIAHELNNKLTPVLAYAELLEESDLNPQDRRRIETIAKSAMGAKKIVQSLLLFTRQEKPHKKLVDINEVIQNTLNLMHYQLHNDNISLKLDLAPGLPDLFADFHQMEQVFLNVIKNAFEAMEGRGGELSIRSTRNDQNVLVEIGDTGVGIPSEAMPVIFDPFFTTKEEGKGTGLGLSLCHGIIQEHGGDVSVSSRQGKTTFQIRLPLAKVPSEKQNNHKPRDTDMEKTGRKAILVIDDEPSIALLLSELLEGKYDVVSLSNGQEALEAVAAKDFDLIISDIKMPGIDGMEFFKWIEENKPAYKDKIVFTTGVVFDVKVQTFLEETKKPFLTKPFKIAQLMETVEAALR